MLVSMDIKENIINASKNAFENVLTAAKAMPEDKLTWSPLGEGRTAIHILAECAQCPNWGIGLLKTRKFEWDEARMEESRKELESLTSIQACEELGWKNAEAFFAAIREFPESDMEDTVRLPFRGGMDMSFVRIMGLMVWNCNYHEGQLNYIQTLYGDKEMH